MNIILTLSMPFSDGFPDFTCVSTCSAASACWTGKKGKTNFKENRNNLQIVLPICRLSWFCSYKRKQQVYTQEMHVHILWGTEIICALSWPKRCSRTWCFIPWNPAVAPTIPHLAPRLPAQCLTQEVSVSKLDANCNKRLSKEWPGSI